MQPMLEIKNISTHYGAICAVNDVSLHVNEGEIVSLIGSNGAGKTTLLMSVCGNPCATTGSIRFEGEELVGQSSHLIMRKGIAISPEGRRVFKDLTVMENLQMGAFFLNKQEIAHGIDYVYGLFPRLKERADQRAGTMSGVEQQMLAIGRALMTNPHLLILDEATEGLAPLIREEIWQCLAALRAQGQAILVIDKYVKRLMALADRHTLIERGQVVWQGSSAQLEAQPALWQRYIGV